MKNQYLDSIQKNISKGTQELYMKRAMIVAIVIMVTAGYAFSQSGAGKAMHVVPATGINLRESPSLSGRIITALPQHTKLVILEKGQNDTINGVRNYWYRVNVGGRVGWVFGAHIAPDENKDKIDIGLLQIPLAILGAALFVICLIYGIRKRRRGAKPSEKQSNSRSNNRSREKGGAHRNCATCRYFTGARSTDMSRSRVIYDLDAEGQCQNAAGLPRVQADQTCTCGGWEKWSVLK
jgi:hypothetical protein